MANQGDPVFRIAALTTGLCRSASLDGRSVNWISLVKGCRVTHTSRLAQVSVSVARKSQRFQFNPSVY